MKKFISFLVSAAIAAGFFAVPAAAEDFGFVYPYDGAQIIKDEFTEIKYNAPAGTECYVLLDGELLQSDSTEGSAKLPKPAAIGEHRAELLTPEGKIISEFTVTEKKISESCFNDFSDVDVNADSLGKYGTALMVYDGTEVFGKDADGNPAEMKKKAFAGVDGDEKGAAGWYMENGVAVREVPQSRSNTIAFKDDATGDLGLNDGNIRIEYDLEVFAKCDFSVETRFKKADGTHDWASFGGMILNSDGTISISSDEYKIGEGNWMHVEHVVNTEAKTEKLYIDGNLYLNDTPFTLNGKLNSIKLQYFIRNSDEGQGFAVDNFRVSHEKFYGEYKELSYSNEQSGAFKRAQNSVVSAETLRLRLKNDNSLLPASDITENSSLWADGVKIKLESVKTDSDGYLRVVLKNGLPDGAEAILYFGDDETEYIEKFKTKGSSLSVSDVVFEADNQKIYFKSNLFGKSSVSISANLKNTALKPQKGVLLICVYNEGRITKTEAVNVSASSGSSTVIHSVDLDEDLTAPDISVFLIDNFSNYGALSKCYSLY